MPDDAAAKGLKPATPYLKITDDGRPFLRGSRCENCGAVFVGERSTCAACSSLEATCSIELATTGRLYNYTVVHRSYPGVKVPFISAIVDLDGGGTLKGNLIEIDPRSDELKFDMPVEVVFRGAEIANSSANGFVSHFFIPANQRQGK